MIKNWKPIGKSKVLQFERCPFAFKIQYINGLKLPEQLLSPAMVRGSEIHKMTDDFYEPSGLDINNSIKHIRQHKHYDKHADVIEDFISKNLEVATKSKNWKPILREKMLYDRNRDLKGTIDAVFFDGKHIALVDYKTGSRYLDLSSNKIPKNFIFELAVYTHLVRNYLNQNIDYWGIWFLDHNKVIFHKVDEMELQKALRRVESVYRHIEELIEFGYIFEKCKKCKFCRHFGEKDGISDRVKTP